MKKRDIQRRCKIVVPKHKHLKHKHKRGDKVTVVNSVYSGVTVGDVGTVECLLKPGYGVAFIKTWPATVINEKNPHGKRVLFFEHGEVE